MRVKAFSDGTFEVGEFSGRCALGRSGVIEAEAKREGDLASPLGAWPIRRVLYRADRVEPPATALSLEAIAPDDGWCDDPTDRAYNRPVKLPYPASAERMWRDDHVYDLVVVLGHNDDPPTPGAGSAIFWHLARDGYAPTEGCIAVSEADMRIALSLLHPGDVLEIARAENG